MNLLAQFISRTGWQPADWTSQDRQNYLDYVKAQVTGVIALKRYERLSNERDLRHSVESLRAHAERSEGSLNIVEIRDPSLRSE